MERDTTAPAEATFFFRVDGLGPVPSLKNSKDVIKRRGSRQLIPTTNPKTKRWMRAAVSSLRGQVNRSDMPRHLRQTRLANRTKDRVKRIAEELSKAATVRVLIGISSLRSADPDNALTTIMDCLRDAKIISEDSPRYVASAGASLVPVEQGEEFASITITYRPQ